ncbi:MAG: NarK family nitrate/nitrite MFS transporter [Actinomycetota bacterium]
MRRRGLSRWIHDWNPNDETFWETRGKRIARRNLVFSILAEFLGFSVWLLWSAIAVNLNRAGFDLSVDQLFWLVSLPALVGAAARLPYGAMVSIMGGRNFTVLSAALLLIPSVSLGVLVQDPTTPYWMLLLSAATAGFGGGNFASSMANISFFFPESKKGFALGLNAAGGNIGVAVVQFLVPAVIGLGILGLGGAAATDVLSLEWAAWMWVPAIVVAVVCAWFFMDNLAVSRASIKEQATALRRRHTWIISWLYVGTFGSFIGFSAALPLLIKTQFPDVNPLQYAFLGPLVGSIARPFGGWLADRVGGAILTVWCFLALMAGTVGVILALDSGSFAIFLATFLCLFVASGVGNGSTYRMIPTIFRAERLRHAKPGEEEGAEQEARKEAAAAIAISSAIGAFGGFFIPKSFGTSISATGGVEAALIAFVAFYVTCLGLTWWCYMRRSVVRRHRAVLADVRV